MIGAKTLLRVIGLDTKSEGDGRVLTKAALASYPAPVFEARGDGPLSCLNHAAETLAASIDLGNVPAIGSAVSRTLDSGRSQVEVVVVPVPAGTMLYEMNLLPVQDGSVLIFAKDVTLESNLRSALVESRQRYKDLVEISSDFTWEVGPDGTFVFVSPRGALGHLADQLVGHSPAEFIVDQPGVNTMLPFTSDRPVEDAEIWMHRQDGSHACLLTSSSPLLDAIGTRCGARGVCRDVTRERERDAALARANNRERLLTHIVRTIRDVVDPSDMLSAAAEATAGALGAVGCEIFRYSQKDFKSAAAYGTIGDSAAMIAAFSIQDQFEEATDKGRVLALLSCHRKEINGAVAVWRDPTAPDWSGDDRLLLEDVANQIGIANEQITNHERILTLSRTDSLTGLFNRRAFFEELSRRFTRLARDRRSASLIYLDLDNFKMVNDVFGHRRGDEALLAVRDILLHHTRPVDLLARLGGDEFAMWLEGADEDIAIKRCEEMVKAARAFAHYSGNVDYPLTMSMGLAIHRPEYMETLQDLLVRADTAMYAAKREGKGTFRLASAPTASTSGAKA